MPHLIAVFFRHWKFIVFTSLAMALIALVACLFTPKKFLSVATALPANSALSDKARIFNNNIEALYSELGSPDELDRLEGTATLDTLYIAASKKYNLAAHYTIKNSEEATYKAAQRLKKESKVMRTGYGELSIKVWDEDRNMAAMLANELIQSLEALHRHLQTENNLLILQQLKAKYATGNSGSESDSLSSPLKKNSTPDAARYQELMREYELSVQTSPKVLLTVEAARTALRPDKPKVLQTVVFSFVAAFACTFLVSLLFAAKKSNA